MFERKRCAHTDQIKDVEPSGDGCEECYPASQEHSYRRCYQ